MTYYYSLTRTLDDGSDGYSTTVSISDRDAVNCAHMVANGFNTMSRNFTVGWVLGVVHPETGEVQYDGKIEQIKRDELKRDEPWSFSSTMHFTADPEGDHIVTLFDNENGRLTYPGKFKFPGTDEAEKPVPKKIHRKVLEAAYDELQAVKEVLADAGVETIPADRGATDLRAVLRARDLEIAELRQTLVELAPARNAANEAARAELIEHVKRAYAKWGEVDPGRQREGLKSHLRGMIEVLSKYLVAIGEADADERHAVALRVCEIPEGNYLYGDA